jgi:hypothetical protein
VNIGINRNTVGTEYDNEKGDAQSSYYPLLKVDVLGGQDARFPTGAGWGVCEDTARLPAEGGKSRSG